MLNIHTTAPENSDILLMLLLLHKLITGFLFTFLGPNSHIPIAYAILVVNFYKLTMVAVNAKYILIM